MEALGLRGKGNDILNERGIAVGSPRAPAQDLVGWEEALLGQVEE